MTIERLIGLALLTFVISISIIASLFVIAISEEGSKFLSGTNATDVTWGPDRSHLTTNEEEDADNHDNDDD